MPSKRTILLSLLLALLPLLAAWQVSAEALTANGVKISEIKLGGGSDPKEFVELFNDSSNAVDLAGLQLEYAKATFSPASCDTPSWKAAANPATSATAKALTGTLEAYGFAVVEMSLTDNVSGSLRLISSGSPEIIKYDLVGWGDFSLCYAQNKAPLPGSGQVIKRFFGPDQHLIISNPADNSADFSVHAVPMPGNDECLLTDCYETDGNEDQGPLPTPYKQAYITELLPDPASPLLDAEDEFVELFNPHSEPLDLTGYKLYSASQASTYQSTISGVVLQPGQYLAMYSRDTGLSLVNGKTGYSWLAAPDGTVVYETAWYPSDIGTGQAWASDNNNWTPTDTPTPGAANLFQLMDVTATQATDQCPAGKFRNPETGRCKTLDVIAAALQPCKPNQQRSTDTNRCRNITNSTTVLAPCKDGQIRSQDTKRCRNITSTTKSTCLEGYERNTDTNRCRKVASSAVKSATTEDKPPPNPLNYILIAGFSMLLVAYAVYEYRNDILTFLAARRGRLIKKKEEVIQ